MNLEHLDLRTATIDELTDAANGVLSDSNGDPLKIFRLAKRLADHQRLEYACRLAEVIDPERRTDLAPRTTIEILQSWAMWLSKNPDRPDDRKHDDALRILARAMAREPALPSAPPDAERATTRQESLGIRGGILKRRWSIDGRRDSLEQALDAYEQGAAIGVTTDNGYTAINAAYVIDLIASLDAEPVPTASARRYRSDVLAALPALADQPAYEGGPPRGAERWYRVTIAEAQFGLEAYDDAIATLKGIDWEEEATPGEFETTARQFAGLARIFEPGSTKSEEFANSEGAWRVVREGFGAATMAGVQSLFAGKLGLALSGGGFRASLYHIGVLAGLAELDLLRHVEVMSCVSGGSILGAQYYLEVRRLLQTQEEISRDDYIALIEKLTRDFLAGVQQNIRTRVATSPIASIKMMFKSGYTRTNRLGELYQKHLYSRVRDGGERRLRELLVRPKGQQGAFNPKYDNWKRAHKVPILILNATTVNTGHNWQFTASWMGEPPNQIDGEIDGNERLRRMYIASEAPEAHRDITIGEAAAASSCVPGLFPPFELRDLYADRTIQLVDGGVHDNQGIFGLLEQNCTVFIVSDASGQMSSLARPPGNPLSVLLRTSNVSMARIRTSSYRELRARLQSDRIKGLLFLHLKHGLSTRDVDWIGCDDKKQSPTTSAANDDLTVYGVSEELQQSISAIRTDLDSFCDIEAFALMASGLKMVRESFASDAPAVRGFATAPTRHAWPFLDPIEASLAGGDDDLAVRVKRVLEVARQRALKVWSLSPSLRFAGHLVLVALLICLVWWAASRFWEYASSLGGVAVIVGGALLALFALLVVTKRKTLPQVVSGIWLVSVGWVMAGIHLLLFDPVYLAKGRLVTKTKAARSGTRRPEDGQTPP